MFSALLVLLTLRSAVGEGLKAGEGLSEAWQRMQKEGRSHTEITIAVFQHIFYPEPLATKEPTKLKVFCAGLGRSGTGSLAAALTQLGYKPFHGPDTMEFASDLGEHYA